MDMTEVKIIQYAKEYNDPRDPSMSVYMCRDLQITKDAGLTDLAWALTQETCSKNDVIGFFELLDKYVESKGEK